MNKEEIILKIPPSEDLLFIAMDVFAKQESIAFAEWLNENEFSPDINTTTEELYTLFKSKA